MKIQTLLIVSVLYYLYAVANKKGVTVGENTVTPLSNEHHFYKGIYHDKKESPRRKKESGT